MQDLSYHHSTRGDLTLRRDNLQVDPAFPALGATAEWFESDGLGRLVNVHVGKGPLPPASPALHVDYDLNGNILSKSDVGPYTYDPDHVHAVKAANGVEYTYDSVGNQISRGPIGVTYTIRNQPEQYTLGDGSTIDFEYTDGARLRKASAASETIWLGAAYERTTDLNSMDVEHRYHVVAAGRVVADVVRSTALPGVDTVEYQHVDHLGSLDVITGDGGAVMGRFSFDAFGKRRHPDWLDPSSPGSPLPALGFTAQQEDAEIGVIDMKARLYDPVLGRFTGVDPRVANPLSSQNWNAYSYVLNAPVLLTDPTGMDPSSDPIAADPFAGTDPNAGNPYLDAYVQMGYALWNGMPPEMRSDLWQFAQWADNYNWYGAMGLMAASVVCMAAEPCGVMMAIGGTALSTVDAADSFAEGSYVSGSFHAAVGVLGAVSLAGELAAVLEAPGGAAGACTTVACAGPGHGWDRGARTDACPPTTVITTPSSPRSSPMAGRSPPIRCTCGTPATISTSTSPPSGCSRRRRGRTVSRSRSRASAGPRSSRTACRGRAVRGVSRGPRGHGPATDPAARLVRSGEKGDRPMDPVEGYRDAIMAVLRPWEQRPGPQSTLRFEAVFDREHDRYLVVVVGWDGHHHVHSTLVHVDVIDGKVWIQHDQTEQGVAPELVAAGVPRDRIVLGFKSPARRAVTEYAVG